MISFYPLDESESVAKDYLGSNDGTLYNEITQGSSGNVGKAYKFDGKDDRIKFGEPEFNVSDSYTWGGWGYVPKSADMNNDGRGRFYQNRNHNYGCYMLRFGADGHIIANIKRHSSNTPNSEYNATLNEWHHIMAVYYGNGTLSLYVDGKKRDSATQTEMSGSSTAGDWVAGYYQQYPSYDNHFDGRISNLRIYNRSLSKNEIQALYFNKVSIGNEESKESNSAPIISSLSPSSINTDSSGGVELSVHVEDADNEKMIITFYDASDDSNIGKVKNKENGTYTVNWKSLSSDSSYSCYVKVNDRSKKIKSSTKTFTTHRVDLSWTDNSDNEKGFKIYNNASGDLQQTGKKGKDSTNYISTDKNLKPGRYICFRVKSYNKYGSSNFVQDCITP